MKELSASVVKEHQFGVLKGHDFSRADKAHPINGAGRDGL
jgi:hypothetical protein